MREKKRSQNMVAKKRTIYPTQRRSLSSDLDSAAESSTKQDDEEEEEEDDVREYVVERVLNKKVDANGRVSYFLKWQGFPE
jgi:hypothetical protein